jgi:hypothetical protein
LWQAVADVPRRPLLSLQRDGRGAVRMDDDVDPGQADEADSGESGDEGISRRTLIRRSAIAGGSLLWATPVVQSLGNDAAYAWFRGSKDPGGCTCHEEIVTIVPVSCIADRAGKRRLAPAGKTVVLQVVTGGNCGTRLHCQPVSETHVWTQVSAVGCELVTEVGDTCSVHVSAYPASIVLQVTSTLTCLGGRGRPKACSDTKVRKICFSQVTGYASQRCGRFPPHKNTMHGTERCGSQREEGCSPGYWKNHLDAWVDTDYAPNHTVSSVFTLPAELSSLSGETLLKALGGGGGRGLVGAAKILLRAAVAAVLNASNPNVEFGSTPAAIINDVNQALASKNRQTILALATKLDTLNNRGCPLH